MPYHGSLQLKGCHGGGLCDVSTCACYILDCGTEVIEGKKCWHTVLKQVNKRCVYQAPVLKVWTKELWTLQQLSKAYSMHTCKIGHIVFTDTCERE